MTLHRKKCPQVVHFNVPRDWFERNSQHQKRYSEDGKKIRGCYGPLGRVICGFICCFFCWRGCEGQKALITKSFNFAQCWCCRAKVCNHGPRWSSKKPSRWCQWQTQLRERSKNLRNGRPKRWVQGSGALPWKINPNCSTNAALHIHVSRIPCPNLYMMSRIARKRKYFNIRVICENLPAGCISAVLPFHALTPVATQHPSYETIQRIQLGK